MILISAIVIPDLAGRDSIQRRAGARCVDLLHSAVPRVVNIPTGYVGVLSGLLSGKKPLGGLKMSLRVRRD